MEKKFTRAMVCKEFHPGKCRECPLNSGKNPKSLPCWLIDESDIQNIMEDYPYTDVKVRMIFNDIETRLTAVEKKVEKKDEPKFTMFEVINKKSYDKLEAKHEADCRLISEYDLEIKKLEERCEHLREMDKKRFFDFKNAENERDHYKGLYSSKCDDYDKLLEKKIKNEKSAMEEVAKYKNLFHSLNHKHQKVVGEMKAWKERAMEAERNEDYLKRKFEKPEKLRTVLETENSALRKTLEATKEKYESINIDYIGLEKEYNTVLSTKNSLEFRNKDLINENNKLRKTYNDATDNTELEGKLEAKSCRIAALEDKLRYQRANLTSLEQKLKETEEKYNDACVLNKMREDVFEANIKLQKTIEAKDREIGFLRAELDKYKTDDECDDRWID